MVANFPSLPFCSHGSIRHVFAVFWAAICYDKQTSTIQHGASCFPLQLRNKNTYRNTVSGFNVRYCSVQWLPHISFHKSPPTIQLWNRLHWNCQFFFKFCPTANCLNSLILFQANSTKQRQWTPKMIRTALFTRPEKGVQWLRVGCVNAVIYCR